MVTKVDRTSTPSHSHIFTLYTNNSNSVESRYTYISAALNVVLDKWGEILCETVDRLVKVRSTLN